MTTLETHLATLQRPGLLVRTARIACQAHDALRRAKRRSVVKLLDEEEKLNAARLDGDAGYSPTRHVQVMSALMVAATL